MAKILFLNSISIIYKSSKDSNYKNKDLKTKIYYIILKTILQYIFFGFSYINFKKKRC